MSSSIVSAERLLIMWMRLDDECNLSKLTDWASQPH